MTEQDDDHLMPEGARWMHLTDELLDSSEGMRLRGMVEDFEPLDHVAGVEMARWLREGARRGRISEDAHVICTEDELLGFFAVNRVLVDISFSAWPLFELRRRKLRKRLADRKPQPGLMLVSIARSCNTRAGFGRVLFDHALGLAFEDSDVVAVVVSPDNEDVSRMWRERYGFRRMENPRHPGYCSSRSIQPPKRSGPSGRAACHLQ